MTSVLRFMVLAVCLAAASPCLAQPEDAQPRRGLVESRAFEDEQPRAEEAAQPKTDAEIRRWYNERVAKIPELDKGWQEQGLSAEERARRAYKIRHDARIEARAMMPSRTAVFALRARDLIKYGSPDGPSFDYLVKKQREKGLRGDAIYEAIVGSARRTNAEVNRRLGVDNPPRAGPQP